ncbi:hypothetical protein [Roseicella aerolata]|uniref:Uncharacterized protein n=1 Tax=Roseicella aerolata TaxID=2883479 RepID=A0A9X1LDM3_9PROT|nr:hypothetical protein [Roseicella aerolata]MCB4825323.1 hypothetical protein [Roseicella aerolata]
MTAAPAAAAREREGTAELPAPADTDWLYHHLRVTGTPETVAAFRAAAAGAGLIPWTHDAGAAAERWFHLLLAPPPPAGRTISLEGARILAGQLRDAVEARGQLVAERAPESRACPLDLHRLLPVPDRLLRLGPDHRESHAWLWEHWGTTEALRGVVELPIGGRGGARRRDSGLYWAGFWSADWTPWPALLALRARWPRLRLDLRPLYDGP